jgi:hypothetical protein
MIACVHVIASLISRDKVSHDCMRACDCLPHQVSQLASHSWEKTLALLLRYVEAVPPEAVVTQLDAAAAMEQASAASGAPDGAPATALVSEAWAVLGLHEAILGRLAAAGFKEPTPIQRECLPAALHGRRDVIGAAEVSATDDH